MLESYRSYVIRVRRRATDAAVRLDVEDLLGGRRVAVMGDEARLLAERLRSMVANGDVQPETRREEQGGTGDDRPAPVPSPSMAHRDRQPRPPTKIRDSA